MKRFFLILMFASLWLFATAQTKPVIEWANIPAGTFTMGSPASEVGRDSDETQHQVTLSAFKMSKHEVTFEQYDLYFNATRLYKHLLPHQTEGAIL